MVIYIWLFAVLAFLYVLMAILLGSSCYRTGYTWQTMLFWSSIWPYVCIRSFWGDNRHWLCRTGDSLVFRKRSGESPACPECQKL